MKAQRFDSIDALRGVAIVWMTLFHFSFDLNHFSFIRQNFYTDPFWTGQRTLIVSLFLFCAGLGQAIAVQQGQTWQRFWRRWAQVAGCAVLVTVGSLFMFPNSFIYFGVLHGIAVMLIVVRLTAGWGSWLWLAGAVALLVPLVAGQWLGEGGALAGYADLFNSRPINWLGLITRKPITEDYVPLIPWLGVMWWGMAAGQWVLRRRPAVVARPMPSAVSPLTWLGRWSLSWYMLHQPVLLGLLAGVQWLVGKA
ncbi:MAG: DUF1624 domain-containing protein [Bdellovibrionales bacterium]|nr:DUF1624 domain-containing protein [Ramlibacter sp.]